jgi:uracil-DNA glycosylase
MTKLEMLKMVKDKCCQCTKCPELVASRKQIVFDNINYEEDGQLQKSGNPNAEIVFVGEGPGKNEDESGRPFVGPAGQFLDKIIKACGWKREDIYILNIVKCRPPANRVPTYDEATNCSKFLKLQLKIIQPKIIVCLGATACRYIVGFEGKMNSYRGEWYTYQDGSFSAKVRCTYHPSYILHIEDKDRKKEEKDKIWEDMKAVIEALK